MARSWTPVVRRYLIRLAVLMTFYMATLLASVWLFRHNPPHGLIAYVLAAASETYPVDPDIYHDGFAASPSFRNGKLFHGVELPLGVDFGGQPLVNSTGAAVTAAPRPGEDPTLEAPPWAPVRAKNQGPATAASSQKTTTASPARPTTSRRSSSCCCHRRTATQP